MRLPSAPWHWITIATVAAIALLTLGEAHGQGIRGSGEGLDKAAPTVPAVPRDPGLARPGKGDLKPPRDRDRAIVRKERDTGGVTEQARPLGKAKRAAKRTVERARRGVGGVDS